MRALPVNFPSPFCSHPPLLFTAYSVQPNCSSWFIERFSCLDTCGYALYTYEKLMVGIVQIRRKQRALVKIKKAPDFFRNQELFGGDCWTRTSDLLRVKMRRDVKALLLGAFRHFWPHFLWVQITALSTVSTR